MDDVTQVEDLFGDDTTVPEAPPMPDLSPPIDPKAELLWGFYSPTSAANHGTVLYLDVNGREVVVTEVMHQPDIPADNKIPDLRPVGQVVKYVSTHRNGRYQYELCDINTNYRSKSKYRSDKYEAKEFIDLSINKEIMEEDYRRMFTY